MKALFENIDLFAHKVNFNYDKKNLYHSFFGISLTFAVYGTMIYFVYYFSIDFVQNTNPKVLFKETASEDEVPVYLNDLLSQNISFKFYFDVSTKDYNTLTLKEYLNKTSNHQIENIGEFFINHVGINSWKKIVYFNYSLELEMNSGSCSIYGILDLNNTVIYLNDKQYKDERINVNNSDVQFNLEGGDNLAFAFRLNRNLSNLLRFGDDIYTSFNFGFQTKDNVINANSDDFFKQFKIGHNSKPEFVKKDYVFKSEAEDAVYEIIGLNDDLGFITSKKKEKYGLKKKFNTKSTYSNKQDLILYNFKIDRVMKNYERVYKKLQNVLADLGGIMNSFILLGNIIIVSFNKKKYDYDLINKVFKIEEEEENFKMESNVKAYCSNSKIQSELIHKNISLTEINSSTSRDHMKSFNKKESSVNNNDDGKSIYNEINVSPISNLGVNISSLNHKDNFSLKHPDLNQSPKYFKIENKVNELNHSEIEVKKDENDLDKNIDVFIEKYKKGSLFKKPIRFSKKDFFKTFLCCNKLKGEDLIEKEKVFKLAQNQLYEYLDVINFIKLFEKIDQIVSVFLNEQQALSINFIKNRKINDIEKRIIDKQGIKKIIEYYQENMKESKMSVVDERLIKALYPCFSKMI